MSYHIKDEPHPSTLSHLAVNPVWPLFGVMFGGALVSWTWFVVNAVAVGSPTRRREIAWAAGGFAGSFALILAIFILAGREVLDPVGVRYALLALTVWKLLVSYWLYVLQSRNFNLYEHFGGQVRNGVVVVIAAFFLVPRILGGLPTVWALLLR